MANPEHLRILKRGIEAWNRWRLKQPEILPDLHNADLHGKDLHKADFHYSDLHKANLQGADLREGTLDEVLKQSTAWDAAAKSVVVAEGVVMYLGLDEVADLLAAVRSSTGRESRLLLTFLQEEELNRVLSGWLGTSLKYSLHWMGEPFRWGVTEEGIEPLLAMHGYRVLGDEGRYDLRRRYLEPVAKGDQAVSRLERVVAAEPLA